MMSPMTKSVEKSFTGVAFICFITSGAALVPAACTAFR